MWNVKLRTEDGIPRTNNKLEGWHRGFQSMFDSPHPSIFRFFGTIKKKQVPDLFRLKAGDDTQKQKRSVQEINKRILELIERLHHNGIDRAEFLRGVLYNISLKV